MIEHVQDKSQWDEFVKRHSQNGAFLQSWGWGEFQRSLGRKVWRIAVESDGVTKLAAQIVLQPLPYGQAYFYTPRGPVSAAQEVVALRERLKELETEAAALASKEKVAFWRLEPGWPTELVSRFFFSEIGFIPSPVEVQPRHTLIMDISLPEDSLLKNMKAKARYNLGLASKHGVTVKKITGRSLDFSAKLGQFYALLDQTSRRQEFKTHSFEYFEKMWTTLAKENSPELLLLLAEYQGSVLGGILVSFMGQTATYMHGGMSQLNKEVMAPYLLQWEAVKEARSRGCRYYDFWGVAAGQGQALTAKEKNWEGITRFKTGFAPATKIIEYPGPMDKPYRPMVYRVYHWLKARR